MSDKASAAEAQEFAVAFRAFLDWMNTSAHGEDRNEVVALITDFLGAEGTAHSVVTRELPPLEHVNLQTALDAWCARPGRTVDIRTCSSSSPPGRRRRSGWPRPRWRTCPTVPARPWAA
jgi:hypothetical protein